MASPHKKTSGRTKWFLFILSGFVISTVLFALSYADKYVWEEKVPGPPPSKRFGSAMAYNSDQDVIILFGGMDSITYDDTWIWDGSSWTELTPSSSPSPRVHHRMIYDSIRKKIVLFGGQNGSGYSFNDLWEWDGTNWEEITPSGTPPGRRHGHAMAYNSIDGKTYIFGGISGSSSWYDDFWSYDGNSWTQITSAGPSQRSNASMVYVESNNTLFLHGGHYSYNNIFNDSWVWDGTNWTELTPGHVPPAYDCLALEYMRESGFIMRFGGVTTPGVPKDETWIWDGNDWIFVSLMILPGSRYAMAHAYDSKDDEMLIFGGHTGTVGYSSLSDTWAFHRIIIDVDIDIKPGSYPNSINLGSNGGVPVAIFSSEDFDATSIDPMSITLAGASVRVKGKGTPQASAEDVDGDGLLDLIVHVDTTALQLCSTDTEAILEGETYDELKIKGVDTVRIVKE